MRDQLQPLATTQVNRDFSPIAYYFNVVLWSAQFKPDYAGWLRAAEHVDFRVCSRCSPRRSAFRSGASGVCARARATRPLGGCLLDGRDGVHADGARKSFCCLPFNPSMATSTSQLAILIALFMAGIALGSWLGLRRIRRDEHSACRAVAFTQFLLALSAPVLMLLVSLLAKLSGVGCNLAGRAVRLSCAGRALRHPGRLPVSHGDGDLSARRKRAAKARHALCHRLAGRMRGRTGAERLSHSGLWILEDRMALRGGESGAGSAGRAGELPTFAKDAKRKSYKSV